MNIKGAFAGLVLLVCAPYAPDFKYYAAALIFAVLFSGTLELIEIRRKLEAATTIRGQSFGSRIIIHLDTIEQTLDAIETRFNDINNKNHGEK